MTGDTMLDTMLNDAMTGTAGRPGFSGRLTEYFLRRNLTAAANELAGNVVEGAKSTPQPLKRGHIFNDFVARLKSCPSRPWRRLSVVATSISLLCVLAPAQTQNQTQAQTRRQLLQDLESGQLRDAVLLGQQAVSRWPRDAQFRHYLGVAYFKTGDPKQAQEQLTRARELNPKDSATHFDLALVFLSQPDYAGAAEELETAIKLRPSNALAHMLLGRAYLNSNR